MRWPDGAAGAAAAGSARATRATPATSAAPADDATLALGLLAVDPAGLGGALLRSGSDAARLAWLAALRALLPADAPLRRLPPGADPDVLLGTVDVAATLATGRRVLAPGLLAAAAGGVLVVPLAELVDAATAAHVAASLDLATHSADAVCVVACVGGGEEDGVAAVLAERLALAVALPPHGRPDADALPEPAAVRRGRERLSGVEAPAAALTAVCRAAARLGIPSVRTAVLAVRAARASAALAGRAAIGDADLALAARLVLAPRATMVAADGAPDPDGPDADAAEGGADGADGAAPADGAPAPGDDGTAEGGPADGRASRETDATRDGSMAAADAAGGMMESGGAPPARARERAPGTAGPRAPGDPHRSPPADPADAARLADVVLAAARAALPPDLLAADAAGAATRGRGPAAAGRRGPARLERPAARGRRGRSRPGRPGGGAGLDLLATIAAAAPWQRARALPASPDAAPATPAAAPPPRLALRREDLRVRGRTRPVGTTTVFLVDASGSAALSRLAEAKGAVELLLAESYVRRDEVALVAFRGRRADVLLPPSRALARARRLLAALPAGGGTPLAAGLVAGLAVAAEARRRGREPRVVLLTDGRANVALDGRPGRALAEPDALAAARALRALGAAVVCVDASPRGEPFARRLAEAAGARYVALPHADARSVHRAIGDGRGERAGGRR